jgi:hypothetical protein
VPDQSGPAAHDDVRHLPDRPSLRHLKLEAKRRLAAGEFTTLHDHFTDQFLGYVSPEAIAEAMGSLADKLREDLILIDADSSRLSAKFAGLRVDAAVAPEAPHRLEMLRFFPAAEPVTDTRVTRPPSAGSGPVPERAGGLIGDAYTEFSLVGLTAAGDADSGGASEVWTCSRGWADLEGNVQLGPGHCYPARRPGQRALAFAAAGRCRRDRPGTASSRRCARSGRGRAVVDRAGPGSLRVRLADAAARGTGRRSAAPAGGAARRRRGDGSRLGAAALDGCRALA